MDAIERIKDDLRKGRIDPERLVEVLEALQRALDAARRRIAELEKKLGETAATRRGSTSRFRCAPKSVGRKLAASAGARGPGRNGEAA